MECQAIAKKRHKYASSFFHNFYKNTGLELDSDDKAYILSICNETEPYSKIDNKGRHSEYFTFSVKNVLVTIVCDSISKVIITGVLETHNRPQFKGK